MTTILCPRGDNYGTAKSHAHGMTNGFQFTTQEEEDSALASITPVYVEVTKEEWALFAINGRSANVTGDIGSFGQHTLWRSSMPLVAFDGFFIADLEVGKESASAVINTGDYHPTRIGLLPFAPLPWIPVRFALNAPAPESGYPTPFIQPSCYIFDDKFFLGSWDTGSGSNQRIEVSDRTFSHFRPHTYNGTELRIDITITSTFYPTS